MFLKRTVNHFAVFYGPFTSDDHCKCSFFQMFSLEAPFPLYFLFVLRRVSMNELLKTLSFCLQKYLKPNHDKISYSTKWYHIE